MKDSQKVQLWWASLRLVLPSLLGALGALLVTAVPAYYNALCSSYMGV